MPTSKDNLHKDLCVKRDPQIVSHKCTCRAWVDWGNGISGFNRAIYPDGSGHCPTHCWYGKMDEERDR